MDVKLKLAMLNARKYSREDNMNMLNLLQTEYGDKLFFMLKEDTKESCLFGAGPQATRFLLELGVDPALPNYKGETAITYAAKYANQPNYFESLKILAEVNEIASDLLMEYNKKSLLKLNDPIAKLQSDMSLLHQKLDILLAKLS